MADERFPVARKWLNDTAALKGYRVASVEFHGEKGQTATVRLESGEEFNGPPHEIMRAFTRLPDKYQGSFREDLQKMKRGEAL